MLARLGILALAVGSIAGCGLQSARNRGDAAWLFRNGPFAGHAPSTAAFAKTTGGHILIACYWYTGRGWPPWYSAFLVALVGESGSQDRVKLREAIVLLGLEKPIRTVWLLGSTWERPWNVRFVGDGTRMDVSYDGVLDYSRRPMPSTPKKGWLRVSIRAKLDMVSVGELADELNAALTELQEEPRFSELLDALRQASQTRNSWGQSGSTRRAGGLVKPPKGGH